jgi:FixJ family two-component response regulator
MNTQTVFIVDDVREVRIALSRLLTVKGYSVSSFESPEQFLREQDFDASGCVLLDLAMPGVSGLDVQRALHDSMSARPIVFLTGQDDIHASVHAMKMGAVDFLTKPVDDSRLVAAVDRALQIDEANRRTRNEHSNCLRLLGRGPSGGAALSPPDKLHARLRLVHYHHSSQSGSLSSTLFSAI